jgi:Tfp pilus assembly protein PilX
MCVMKTMMPHLCPRTVRSGWHDEAGIALMSVILLTVVALLLTGALSAVMLTGMRGTSFARSSEIGHAVAEAGLNATVFRIEAATNPTSASQPIGLETYLATSLGNANTGQPRKNTADFAGTLANGSYAVALTDSFAGDNTFTLTSVGTDQASGRKKTLVAVVRGESVDALNYAMFGNRIEFHNHNKVAYGVSLNTSVFSNGSIQVDRGISIIGPTHAVNTILPNTGPASGTAGLPNTVLQPAGQQGDPNPMTSDPDGQVVQTVPGPAVQAFPTFDFYGAQAQATAAGRQLTPTQMTTLIKNAQDYAAALPIPGGSPKYAVATLPAVSYPAGVSAASVPVQVVHYRQQGGSAERSIAIPNGANPNRSIPLGSSDGVMTPAVGTNLYEIRFVGNPLSDTLLYVSGSLLLNYAPTTLVQIQGSLIVNGSVTIHAATEILAWHNRTGDKFVPLDQSLYTDAAGTSTVATTLAQEQATSGGKPSYDVIYSNWPAIAANGKIGIAASPAAFGGPVHIEGAMYSVSESHIHKSDPYESSYAVGSEIADTIHNCQFFSFAYDPQAKKTLGFYSKAAGRVKLSVIRLQDQ